MSYYYYQLDEFSNEHFDNLYQVREYLSHLSAHDLTSANGKYLIRYVKNGDYYETDYFVRRVDVSADGRSFHLTRMPDPLFFSR